MLAYAQDAQESETPWMLWEYTGPNSNGWRPLKDNPSWHYTLEYRRKVKTIRIGKYDVPEPLRVKPKIGEIYYIVRFSVVNDVYRFSWINDNIDNKLLSKGVVHLTREAAELHAKALISLTKI